MAKAAYAQFAAEGEVVLDDVGVQAAPSPRRAKLSDNAIHRSTLGIFIVIQDFTGINEGSVLGLKLRLQR